MGKHIEHIVNIGRDKDIITLKLTFLISAEVARVFSIVGDDDQWPAEFESRILKRQTFERLIAAFPDFSRVEILFRPNEVGSEVLLSQELIKSTEDRLRYEKLWNKWFDEIENRVSL
jgi:hypothetical protein